MCTLPDIISTTCELFVVLGNAIIKGNFGVESRRLAKVGLVLSAEPDSMLHIHLLYVHECD
jgi:hypothetical protein